MGTIYSSRPNSSANIVGIRGASRFNLKTNKYIAKSEQNITPQSKNNNLDKSLIVDSKIDSLDDKKEKEKPKNSNKIKFVNY